MITRSKFTLGNAHVAIIYGDFAKVQTILASGFDLSWRDHNNVSILHFAASGPNPEIVKLLIDSGALVDAREDGGFTPLHRAAHFSKFPETVKYLLDAGADVNARTKHGWMPIHCAAFGENPLGMKVLLDAGADPSGWDNHGIAPIHIVALWGKFPEMVEYLLDAGVDINARDKGGMTPLEKAMCRGDKLRDAFIKVCDPENST